MALDRCWGVRVGFDIFLDHWTLSISIITIWATWEKSISDSETSFFGLICFPSWCCSSSFSVATLELVQRLYKEDLTHCLFISNPFKNVASLLLLIFVFSMYPQKDKGLIKTHLENNTGENWVQKAKLANFNLQIAWRKD